MSESIIAEGKTTNEAIENGLKMLNTSRKNVEIKVLEQEKRSFFDILAPRVVKVQLTMLEKNDSITETEISKKEIQKKPKINCTTEDLENAKKIIEEFLKKFVTKMSNNLQYEVDIDDNDIRVDINGEDSGILIGYRGETLNSIQLILNSILSNKIENKVRVYLNIDGYKERRKKTLEDLAVRVSKKVLESNHSVTLEPMNAYERKIIHTKLQEYNNISTHSIGEEPNRRIVVEKI